MGGTRSPTVMGIGERCSFAWLGCCVVATGTVGARTAHVVGR
jgi:hypothetical protein